MIKAILFDLQGTLIENGVFPSPIKQVKFSLRIEDAFDEYILKFEDIFMTKKYDSLTEAFVEVSNQFKLNTPEFIIQRLVGLWNKNKLLSKPFPDTIETLENLKGKYKLILVANIDCFSKDIIEKFKLNDYFDEISLSCDTGMLKTDPEFFLTPLKKLNIDPSEALMVGDSMESDIAGAKSAGIKAILIDRRNSREYPDKIISLNELEKIGGD